MGIFVMGKDTLLLKKLCTLSLLVIALLFLQGCATPKNVYDAFMDMELSDEELSLLSEGKLTYDVEEGYSYSDFDSMKGFLRYKAYQYISRGNQILKTRAYTYMVLSVCVGTVIFFLARKAIKVRRMALLIFILGIPLFIFIAKYGVAFLTDLLK